MPERDDLIPIGFRLPASVVQRVDAYCAHIEQKVPGAKLSRSNALRSLIEMALTAEGFAAEQPKGKRSK